MLETQSRVAGQNCKCRRSERKPIVLPNAPTVAAETLASDEAFDTCLALSTLSDSGRATRKDLF